MMSIDLDALKDAKKKKKKSFFNLKIQEAIFTSMTSVASILLFYTL